MRKYVNYLVRDMPIVPIARSTVSRIAAKVLETGSVRIYPDKDGLQ